MGKACAGLTYLERNLRETEEAFTLSPNTPEEQVMRQDSQNSHWAGTRCLELIVAL